MPAVIAAAAATVIGAGTVATAIGYGTTLVASLAFGRYQSRRAQRQAEASLSDRTTPVRQSDAARTIVYGRTRVSGPIVYHSTHGSRRESVSHVIPLAGHEIAGIDDVWFNDKSINPWTGGPVLAGSPYFLSRQIALVERFTGGGSGSLRSLPASGGTLVAIDTVTYTQTVTTEGAGGAGDSGPEIIVRSSEVELAVGVGYNQVGPPNAPQIQLLTAAAQGLPVTVTYRVDVGDPYARVYPFLGIPAGERDLNLEAWSGGEWAATAIGCNVARLHVLTTWHETLYATGFPNVSAIVRGKKVYDPRLDSTNGGSGAQRANTATTWAYSDNPALCAADYLRDALGFGCASTEIDWPSVIAAANTCDELVPIDSGSGTQKRYAVAGVLSTETERKANLEQILDAMVGLAVYSGGKWIIRAGAYVLPTLDLDEGDLAGGDIIVQARANRRDLFNSVRGRYREPTQLYQVTDFPPYVSSTYATEDGGETIYREIDLPLVDDARRAQRIAKLILFRARQALTIQASFKLSAYALAPGDTCRLTIARYGWTNKVFRVLRREFADLSTVRLTLQEDASAIYSWAFNEATNPDPAPNTGLPDPRFVRLPAGIAFRSDADTYYVRRDGVLVPYVEISWTPPVEDDVYVEVFWKRSSETEFRRVVAPIGASFVWLEGVSAGELLNVYLEAVNGIGARSVRFWQPRYVIGAVQSGAPAQSANLLQNANLSNDFGILPGIVFNAPGAVAVFRRHQQPTQYAVPGTPSSAYLAVNTALTGNGRAGYYRWPAVSATEGETFALYAGLIPWSTNGYVALQWFDAGGNLIGGTVPGNAVAAYPWEGRAWNVAANYQLSAVIAVAPPGTRTVCACVFAGENWSASPPNERVVSVHRPFLGRVPAGTTQLPPWDAGGANVASTALIAPEAVTSVLVAERTSGSVPQQGVNEFYNASLPSILLTGDEGFEDGATLRVHVNVVMTCAGLPTAPSFTDLAVVVGLTDNVLNASGGVVSGGAAFAGFLFDQHFSTSRSVAGLVFSGSVAYSTTTSYVRGQRRRFGLTWQFSPGTVNNANFALQIVGPSSLTIEVIKR